MEDSTGEKTVESYPVTSLFHGLSEHIYTLEAHLELDSTVLIHHIKVFNTGQPPGNVSAVYITLELTPASHDVEVKKFNFTVMLEDVAGIGCNDTTGATPGSGLTRNSIGISTVIATIILLIILSVVLC